MKTDLYDITVLWKSYRASRDERQAKLIKDGAREQNHFIKSYFTIHTASTDKTSHLAGMPTLPGQQKMG